MRSLALVAVLVAWATGFGYPDVQARFPEVDWATLDRLYFFSITPQAIADTSGGGGSGGGAICATAGPPEKAISPSRTIHITPRAFRVVGAAATAISRELTPLDDAHSTRGDHPSERTRSHRGDC